MDEGDGEITTWNIGNAGDEEVEEADLDVVEEVMIDHHPLHVVPEADYQSGGQFRFIVKLRLGFPTKNGQLRWLGGTGWLIRKDLLVTAGHNISNDKYGNVRSIRAYLGYNPNVKPTHDELRYGDLIASPSEWVAERKSKYDVAFVHLESEFIDVKPISYVDPTPDNSTDTLFVVGYPANPPRHQLRGQMCQGSGSYAKPLSDIPLRGMVKHNISTYYGSSGAPLLRKDRGRYVALGTHRGGNSEDEVNYATSIGRHVDVFIIYQTYERFFDTVKQGILSVADPKTVILKEGQFIAKQLGPQRATIRRKSTWSGIAREGRKIARGPGEHEDEEYNDRDEDEDEDEVY